MAIDPVCGVELPEGSTGEQYEYAGTNYRFHGADCKQRFVEEPDLYTGDPGIGRVANRDG